MRKSLFLLILLFLVGLRLVVGCKYQDGTNDKAIKYLTVNSEKDSVSVERALLNFYLGESEDKTIEKVTELYNKHKVLVEENQLSAIRGYTVASAANTIAESTGNKSLSIQWIGEDILPKDVRGRIEEFSYSIDQRAVPIKGNIIFEWFHNKLKSVVFIPYLKCPSCGDELAFAQGDTASSFLARIYTEKYGSPAWSNAAYVRNGEYKKYSWLRNNMLITIDGNSIRYENTYLTRKNKLKIRQDSVEYRLKARRDSIAERQRRLNNI